MTPTAWMLFCPEEDVTMVALDRESMNVNLHPHDVLTPLYAAHELLDWIEQDLHAAGCTCAKPLLGWNPGVGPRCRLCNTQAYKVTQR